MARPQENYNKKEKEKKRIQKREEKLQKKEERKKNSSGSDLESMMMYVDENGNFTDTPPDPTKKKKIKAESIEIGVPKREEEPSETVKHGQIEFFNTSKGFGFIKELGTHEKFFVHVNGLTEEVMEGDKVSFELERGLKGMNAVKVKKE